MPAYPYSVIAGPGLGNSGASLTSVGSLFPSRNLGSVSVSANVTNGIFCVLFILNTINILL